MAPPPGLGWTAIAPPWSSTTRRTIARPRPVPWVLPVKNGSKILSRSSSATPGPRSATSGDLFLSAAPGFEFPDWGGVDHVGGGSHGSLHHTDSLGALLFCGVEA